MRWTFLPLNRVLLINIAIHTTYRKCERNGPYGVCAPLSLKASSGAERVFIVVIILLMKQNVVRVWLTSEESSPNPVMYSRYKIHHHHVFDLVA